MLNFNNFLTYFVRIIPLTIPFLHYLIVHNGLLVLITFIFFEQDMQTKMREHFKNQPDEFMTNPLSLKAKVTFVKIYYVIFTQCHHIKSLM